VSEDKGDNITDPQADVTTEPTAATESQPKAASTEDNKLTDLMAGGAPAADAKPKGKAPDLEAEALRAAEQALAQGEKALADAHKELGKTAPQPQPEAKPAGSSGRKLALRMLLAVNVLAMVIVAMLPAPAADTSTEPPKVEPVTDRAEAEAARRRYNEPWNRALDAADRRDFAAAAGILEAYLADNPRMAPSQQLNTYLALSSYCARNGDIGKSQEYRRRADALEQSHSLPEDLVEMAEAAAASGDQASLRRVWAQFLLQQRQIPSWLTKHVAEAYLQLGDSYRMDADDATERARRQELIEATERLRGEADGGKEQHR